MEKLFIKNRKGQKISVLVDETKGSKELAFVMHGLSAFKEQKQIERYANAFLKQDFTVVRFDTTNTQGESDGNYEDATVTNYLEDLEDVITWASSKSWYVEPFWLAGHSLGGFCVAIYAQKYPNKVKALAPTSTVVSGKLSLEKLQKHEPEKLAEYERTGFRTEFNKSKGIEQRLKWHPHIADRLKYDLLPKVKEMKMPVLMIVGDKDTSTPPYMQEILFNALTCDKELHVIKGAKHTFKEDGHLAEIEQIITNWILKVLNK
jgi:pimeloyl-ACP methyl ester carboxylesterase